MACYSPLDAYRVEGGSIKIGYEPPNSTEKLLVPCGRCFGCRMEYAEMWSLRAQHEASLFDENRFVTLTYAPEFLPWHGSLDVSEFQRFMKRLRRKFEGVQEDPDGRKPIRYFACGEYGSQTGRPHFHACLFNSDVSQDDVDSIWDCGRVAVDSFTVGRARYVAGYAAKKAYSAAARSRKYEVFHPETGEMVERRREFVVMSRKPAIGARWLDKWRGDLRRGYMVDPGGTRKRLPRYYRERMLEDADFAAADEERRAEYLAQVDHGELSDERLRVRETVHRSRVGVFRAERGL